MSDFQQIGSSILFQRFFAEKICDHNDINENEIDLCIGDNDLNDDDELRTTCKRQSCSLSAHCRQSQVCKL